MKRSEFLTGVLVYGILAALLLLSPIVKVMGKAGAASVDPLVSLAITQLKVTTGDQFITVVNNGNQSIADLSVVQLVYYNNNDRSKATSSKLIPLSGELPANSFVVVSDGVLALCFKATVISASLSFSTTSGTLEIVKVGATSAGSAPLSSVRWASKNPPAGVQLLPSGSEGFLNFDASTNKWLPVTAPASSCEWQTVLAATVSRTTLPQKAPVIKPVAAATTSEEDIAQNTGLTAPELTELFPNPKTPETDAENEFIELYNPNDVSFGLAGYRLEVGMTFSRGYTFKEGRIAAKSYASFPITDTHVQLSNVEGQVRLLAPDGTAISQTAAYEDAPDGESWSLVNDSWQWTNQPTAASPNKSSSTSSPSENEKSTAATTSAKTNGTVAGVSTVSGQQSAEQQLADAAPLHPLVLAAVALAAVAYGLYEYRHDMANRIFQFRRYLRLRKEARG